MNLQGHAGIRYSSNGFLLGPLMHSYAFLCIQTRSGEIRMIPYDFRGLLTNKDCVKSRKNFTVYFCVLITQCSSSEFVEYNPGINCSEVSFYFQCAEPARLLSHHSIAHQGIFWDYLRFNLRLKLSAAEIQFLQLPKGLHSRINHR